MEEREERGVKERIFSLLAHGLKSGVTGQTGDGHWSDRWPPWSGQWAFIGFSDPSSVEPSILINSTEKPYR
jgi:hypothetical protein